jgi:hypothetical protein
MHTKFWFENLKERVHSEDLGVDGRIISKWIFGKSSLGVWVGLIWLGKLL